MSEYRYRLTIRRDLATWSGKLYNANGTLVGTFRKFSADADVVNAALAKFDLEPDQVTVDLMHEGGVHED